MPYCEGKPKAKIKYKYPGDTDWQVFESNYTPVDYSINSTAKTKITFGNVWQCWIFPNMARVYDLDPYASYSLRKGAFVVNCAGRSPTYNYNGVICPITPINDTYRYRLQRNGVDIPDAVELAAQQLGPGNWNLVQNVFNQLSIVSVEPYGGSCTFRIFDTRGQVFNRVDSVCPLVEVVCGDVCPPETVCECDCGEYTCCWDANGIPIYSFLN